MIKRSFIFLIAAFMVFSAVSCKSKETSVSYSSKDIFNNTGAANISSIKMNQRDQLIACTGSGSNTVYEILDSGGKPVKKIKLSIDGNGNIFTFDKSDNMYVLSQKAVYDNSYNITENTRHLYVLNPEGEKIRDMSLGTEKRQNKEILYVNSMAVDSKGNIYLSKSQSPVEAFDNKGNSIEVLKDKMYDFICIDQEDNIIAASMGHDNSKPTLEKVNAFSGKQLWRNELDLGVYVSSIGINNDDNSIYALTSNSILFFNKNGKAKKDAIDFVKYNLVKTNSYINNTAIDTKGRIYLLINGDKSSLLLLSKQMGAKTSGDKQKTKEKKVLNIAAQYSDRWLESAVSSFQADHPDVEIKIKDYRAAYYGNGDTPEEANQRVQEFTKTMDTSLLAGKGPDIVYFGGLPYKKYIDRGIFLKLDKYIKKDKSFDTGKLNMNIINACRYKGIYAIPIGFSFDCITANKSILDSEKMSINDNAWTWDDLISLIQKVKKDTDHDGITDRYGMAFNSPSSMFRSLYSYKIEQYYDLDKKTSNFNSKGFIDLLKLGKSVCSSKEYYPYKDYDDKVGATLGGRIVFGIDSVPGYSMYDYLKKKIYGSDTYLFKIPLNEKGKTRVSKFYPSKMFAVNSGTKFKDEAWEFTKFMLSDSVQQSPEMQNAFPVNRTALKSNAQFLIDNLKYKKEDIAAVDKIIDSLGVCIYQDDKADSILKDEINLYFSGQTTAEETARIIQDKMSTYLGE